MMFVTKLVAALSFLCLETSGEKFQLKLEPAPDFHLATGCCADEPICYVRVADSTTDCENRTLPGPPVLDPADPGETEIVCGGSFSMNLGLYDGIEITFQSPEGKEIFIQSDENKRVEFQFQAKADCESSYPEEYTLMDGSNIMKSFIGSDVDSLETLWNPDQSGVELAACELFGTFQIGGHDDTRSFTAQGSKIIWSFDYDPSLFEDSTLEYSYGTRGYTWIRTPFDNALVDAPPPSVSPYVSQSSAPSFASSTSPSSGPSFTSSTSPSYAPSSSPTTSGGRINSVTAVVLVMLGITSLFV
jgi:hypothetical protein